MDKDKIKEMLKKLTTLENRVIVGQLLESLDKISDEELHTKFKDINVTEDFVKKLIENTHQTTKHTNDFIPVNEWFCYGRTKNTIHLHIIPKDLRGVKAELGEDLFYQHFKDLLEDFLAKMQSIFREDETVKSLFAVSPIFFHPAIASAFESLGFNKLIEINPENNNDNMSLEQKVYFMNMFNKNGISSKKVFYTKMTREKFLKMNYSEIDDKYTYKMF